MLLIYVGLLGLTYYGFTQVPTGFVPNQDKGYLLVTAQLPDAASLERTQAVLAQIDKIVTDTDGVAHRVGIAGQSVLLSTNGSNLASMYVVLEDFHHRHASDLYSDAIAARLRRELYAKVQDAQTAVFGAPPIDGLGNASGFKLMIQDLASGGLEQLQAETDNIVEKGNQTPGLVGLFTMFRADTPQFYIDIDRAKCKTMGVPLNEVFTALQTYLGGYYVNDFNEFDRTWQVNLQADTDFRIRPATARQIKVRNLHGDMVPLGAVASFKDSSGPQMINRYNMFPAAPINGAWPPGTSSGQAVQSMQRLCREDLSPSMGYEWTDLTYQEIKAGNTALFIFPLCILAVFLVHSAEYESWSLPLAIILIVPMSLMCRARRGGAARHGQQHLHSNRLRRAGRPGL